MRVVVAFFLVVGFGMLGVSSITGTVAWGWAAAGVAVAALAVLVADWRRKWAAVVGSELGSGDGSGVAGALMPEAPSAQGSRPAGADDRDGDAGRQSEASRAAEPVSDAGSGGVAANGAAPGVEVTSSVADRGSEGPTAAPPAAPPADGSSAAVRERGEVTATHEPADRPGRPGDDPPADRPAVSGSGVVEPGPRPEVADWFTPHSQGDQSPAGSGAEQRRSSSEWEQAGEGASDATVVFSRVRADGGGATGSVARGGSASPRPSGGERPGERVPPATNVGDEVLVVDELPRYHLVGCRALNGRATIALTEADAQELGFTPCAVCVPTRQRPGTDSGTQRVRQQDGRIRSRT